MLRRRVVPSASTSRRLRTLLHPLYEGDQAVSLEWQRELRHDETLNGEGQWRWWCRTGSRVEKERRSAGLYRHPQSGRVLDREHALDDDSQRRFRARHLQRLGDRVADARLMPRSRQGLGDTFEQRVVRSDQKDDSHGLKVVQVVDVIEVIEV